MKWNFYYKKLIYIVLLALYAPLTCLADVDDGTITVDDLDPAEVGYDFIVDVKGQLLKIQVKTSKLDILGEYFEFATSSSHTNTQGTINRSYKQDEIDYFATMYNNECYVVPVQECGSRVQRLRLQPTKNHQTVGIKFAKDYKLVDKFPND